ncbi:hypothetical protein GL2_12000 [Microbulbifer sp. GL-2]|nr:hypothetical protein GL2_12000 [Microbulbifer sp. GL-2]
MLLNPYPFIVRKYIFVYKKGLFWEMKIGEKMFRDYERFERAANYEAENGVICPLAHFFMIIV